MSNVYVCIVLYIYMCCDKELGYTDKFLKLKKILLGL